MPTAVQPQFQTQTQQGQPWRALPVTYPAATPTADTPTTSTPSTSGRGWVVGAIGWGATTLTRWTVASHQAVNVSGFNATIFVDGGGPFADISADLTPGTDEVCLCFASAGQPYSDGMFDFLFLKVHPTAGQGGIWRFVRDQNGDSDIQIAAITGTDVAANYAVSASGSTLTIQKNGSTIGTVALTGWNAKMLTRPYVGIRGATGTGATVDNLSANAGAVIDTFTRPDGPIGVTDTGQTWAAAVNLRPATFTHQPTDVTGLIWWLKADAITGVSDGSTFTTWPDSSTSSQNASQSTSTLQPIYRAAYMNGKPAVDFDGTDDYLTAALTQSSGDLTAYFVIAPDTHDDTNGAYLFDAQTGRLVMAASVAGGSGGELGWYDGGASFNTSTVPQLDGEACLLEFNLASGAGTVYRNNLSILTAAYTQKAIGGTVAVAAPYDGTAATVFDGKVSEVIIYNSALGSTDRAKLNTYLSQKYGFSL